MDDNIIQYITQYLLKSGEQLQPNSSVTFSNDVVDIPIVKQTARTFRKVGLLTFALKWPDNNSSPDITLQKWTINKLASLQDEVQAFDWLSQGWIIKEIRFKQDERTIERVKYRMGYRLFTYLNQQALKDRQIVIDQLKNYQKKAMIFIEEQGDHQTDRTTMLSPLLNRIEFSSQWIIEELEASEWFPMNWGTVKRIRYLVFILALIDTAIGQELFDWKEIGARYYEEIGGSKAFDADKDEFITLLEEWMGKPVSMIGLISLGKIVPLFFAGHLIGQWSSFLPGPVHSLTDSSIAQDHYRTNARILWLVENRAILTRMAAERNFVQDTRSLIVCVDGHLRSSHKRFIQNVLQNSGIEQVLLWSDYDEDGLLIAQEMTEVVGDDALTLKWICHDHQIMTSWPVYYQYMKELLLQNRLEQEMVLGGGEDWRRWINL